MRAEILFPEVCNLYGDLQNIYYLKRCCPELEIVETDLKSRPAFLDGDVTLVFMGSTTEQGLQLAADALRPYRDAIAEKIDAGQLFLATGNALDILGDAIDSDAAPRIEGLGLLPTRAEYHMMQRHNSYYVGKFGEMDIVGFKSLFGHSHGMGEALFDTVKGVGRDGQGNSGEWAPPGRTDGHVSHRAAADLEPTPVQVAAAGDGRGVRRAGLRGRRHGQLSQACGGVYGAGTRVEVLKTPAEKASPV